MSLLRQHMTEELAICTIAVEAHHAACALFCAAQKR